MTDISGSRLAVESRKRADLQHRVDPQLLPAFLAVADTRKVLAASKVLHLSQPAVTARVRRLERELGAVLFIRSVRGMELTLEGKRLYEYGRRIQGLLAEAALQVVEGREPSGQLLLGASTTIAAYVLPSVLAGFARRFPAVSLRLEVGNTEVILEKVKEGGVPLGLVEGLPRAARMRFVPFVEDELLAVACPTLGERIRRISDLGRFPVLWRERGSGTRTIIERGLRASFLDAGGFSRRMVLGSTEAIKGATIAGMGVSFLSRWSIREELATGKLVPLGFPELRIGRTFHWILPAGALSGIEAIFHDFATRHPPGCP